MKKKLSVDLKFLFEEMWKNEQRFNKLKVMLDEEV